MLHRVITKTLQSLTTLYYVTLFMFSSLPWLFCNLIPILLKNSFLDHSKMKGIPHEVKSFVLIQTKGGGNCLFHSLVASEKVNMTDASILRTYMYAKIAEWASSATQAMDVVCKVYELLQDSQVSLQGFINRQKRGSTLDMAFASLVLNVNIISISNMLKKFEVFSTIDLFRKLRLENYVHSYSETVYIYHHAFGSPFCPVMQRSQKSGTETMILS